MLGIENFPEYEVPGARKVQFYPYESNGGSVVAIAGEDFAVIGADTRLSSGYSIHTRTQNKLFRLSDKTVLASTGCWCDTLALTSLVKVRMQMYKDQHQKNMSTPAVAQMLSILMYNRRFFPYYVSNVLAGLDQDGKGVVYSYDPIGHCEMTTYRAGGSAGPLLQPVLDNQIGQKNMLNADPEPVKMEKAISIIKDTFISATERDIYTGDSVIINIITKDGIKEETLHLRKD
ncbi:proteasome subunit beta type-1 [Anopheles arabiensis]|uniref:AGAP004991-PA n=5 Tax=gambiae species complex TaxID=44542 RepID=Q7Q7W2_ANOGA|nr:proteasome subunit beta type-1 [Anopheles arabiensis]XP_040222877.1 proteasome subunit beta type-1 [Anopheles coluzzii]XP_041771660.1 proteasome subunit beta type-1 [Anopheles merus]XP_315096.4 proteasome subunit beta type-1 [Anopheles gambiae]EAA10482.4 AGAP004991-PA [Anopheles gambiae str. PEST]